jgi:hypothetical protein
MRKGGSWRKGRGDYKDDMICDLGATTEVSYWKGIESIVFHQHIFSESLFIGTDLDTECGQTIEIRQFENMSIGRRIVGFFLSPVSPSGRDSWPVPVEASDHFERDERCQVMCDMVPKKSPWGGVTVYCCGDVKTSGGVDDLSLDDPPCRGPGSSGKKLLGRFIHFWVADRSQSVRRTWHLELGTMMSKHG